MMVLRFIVSESSAHSDSNDALGSIMSESGAHSDSNDAFGIYRVRIRSSFGQFLCFWGLSCPNQRLIQTGLILTKVLLTY
jgi:hypothetical protein